MSYSKAQSGALCRICVLFAPEFSGKGGHQRVDHFVTKPFSNYKDFHELCSSHMKCKYHQTAKELASNFVKCYLNPVTDIVQQVDQSRSKLEDKARQILLPIAKTVLFCGRQGLPLRGHDESNSILT